MKVLILHQHFNTPTSGGPLRSYFLAKALVEKGIEVAVITGGNEKKYYHEVYEGIEVHRVPVAYENRFGFYKRGYSFIQYALSALELAGKIKGVTVCYAISVPLTVGQAAIWIQRKYKIPFYFEVGDLWPEAPVQMGFVQNPFLKHSLYWLERRVYKKAAKIVALSQPIKDYIERKSGRKDIAIIPNMADTAYLSFGDKKPELLQKFGVENKFTIAYIGAIGFANGLDFFLECARACSRQTPEVQFIICGAGALTSHIKNALKTLAIDNVKLIPFQDRQGVKEVLNITDASFICYRPFPILETGSPNKYFDALAAGKLIIVNFRGWIRDEILRHDCGFHVDAKDPREIVTRLRPYLEDRTFAKQKGLNARTLAEEKYSRTKLSAEFTQLFK